MKGKPRQVPGSSAPRPSSKPAIVSSHRTGNHSDHPPTGDPFARGRKNGTFAEALCHRGWPGRTRKRQPRRAFGSRHQQTAAVQEWLAARLLVSERVPPQLMIALAKRLPDEEVHASAGVFDA